MFLYVLLHQQQEDFLRFKQYLLTAFFDYHGTITKQFFLAGYVVKENYFVSSLKKLPMFYDKEFVEQTQMLTADDSYPSAYKEFPELVMP